MSIANSELERGRRKREWGIIYIIYNYKQGRYIIIKYIDGLFLINFIEDITHRAARLGGPPGPGSLRSGCCPPAALHHAVITLNYATLPPSPAAILPPCNAAKSTQYP